MSMSVNPKAVILNDQTYYVIPKGLMSAKTITSKVTGEQVELSMTDKLVFMYLIDKLSFHNQEQRTMFESMATIADELDMSAKTVQRSVKKLVEHGLVSATEKKGKGYTYHAADVDQHWNRGEMTAANAVRVRQPEPVLEAPEKPVESETEPTPSIGIGHTLESVPDASGFDFDQFDDDLDWMVN